jgi:hypothetical protein
VMTLRTQQLNMKNTLETRQADVLLRHNSIYSTQDFMDAWHNVVFGQNYLTYEEWNEKYGPLSNPDAYTSHTAVIQYYDTLGGLLQANLVSIELVEKIWQPIHLICVWGRVEPVIKGWREVYHDESVYENLEYLFKVFMERHPGSVQGISDRREQMIKQHASKVDELLKSGKASLQ